MHEEWVMCRNHNGQYKGNTDALSMGGTDQMYA